MYSTCSLTRIGGVVNGAWLPFLIIYELALEVQCMVDVGKAELDVVSLVAVLARVYTSRHEGKTYSSCSPAPLDAIHLSLQCALASCKFHEQRIRPILFGIESSHTSRSIALGAVAHHVIDRCWTRLLFNKDDCLFITRNLDAVLGGFEVLVASVGGQKPDDSKVGTGRWHSNRLEPTAPNESLEFVDVLDTRDAFQYTRAVWSSYGVLICWVGTQLA